jgi:pyruvate/2-oxoglutarate dehydrogenase complex dihydrolipoamide acyltransferase (E2) component
MSEDITMEEDVKDIEEDVEVEVETSEEAPQEQLDFEADTAARSDDEIEDYNNKVQKRINQLTRKYRDEEKAKEEAARLAEHLIAENKKLQSRVESLDKGYLTEFGGRIESQIEQAKREYREAYEAGEADKMFEAQQKLSQMAIESERLRMAQSRAQSRTQQPEAPVSQAAPAAQPQSRPDPRAEAWAQKNDWFGSDEVMTYAAFGLHRKLVEEEGFDPNDDSYYTELDRRIRAEFPQKFQTKKSGGAQVAPAGASATRTTAKQGRKSVKLSPSQVAMAKRLNVPLEEYAKYVKD